MNSLDFLQEQYKYSNVPIGFLNENGKLTWANARAVEVYPALDFPNGISLYISAEKMEEIIKSYYDDKIKYVVAAFIITRDVINFTKTNGGWIINFPEGEQKNYDSLYGLYCLRANMAISNQLRTPVNEILSSIFSLYYNPEVFEITGVPNNLSNINQGAYKILRSTQLITSYLTLASGNSSNAKEVIDLCALVYQLVQSANILLRSNSLQINQNIDSDPIYIYADPKQIELLILELLSNALKASAENGYISISIKTKNDCACLVVTDGGWGMESEVIAKAFTPFYSFSHTGEPYSGMGLGLTNCRLIAANNKATIAISSQVERGTTVAVKFQQYDGPMDVLNLNSCTGEALKNRFSPFYIIMSEICGAPNP